jgi:hypothetical protein
VDETGDGEIASTECVSDRAHVGANGSLARGIGFLALQHYASAVWKRLEDVLGSVLVDSHRLLAALLQLSECRVPIRPGALALTRASDQHHHAER